MSSSLTLTAVAFAQAAAFLHQARPLERQLFAFHFESGAPEPALAALATFQNPDGGFHDLEADMSFSASSVLSTCHALHLLHDLGVPATHPVVQRALDYLVATYDPARGIWPIIPPHDNSQPHAPWWHYTEKFDDGWQGYVDNPRPDVLAGLQLFPVEKTRALRERVAADTITRLRATQGKIDMNGLFCYIRLAGVPDLPAALANELNRALPAAIQNAVERNPAKWEGYALRPLDVAARADSPWRPLLGSAIEANLDYLIRTQGPEGAWSPHWNWGGTFPEAWPKAKRQWQAVLTLNYLRTLRSYGRIEAARTP